MPLRTLVLLALVLFSSACVVVPARVRGPGRARQGVVAAESCPPGHRWSDGRCHSTGKGHDREHGHGHCRGHDRD